MAFAKFQENRFRIDGEIAENHAILVNLTASIDILSIAVVPPCKHLYELKSIWRVHKVKWTPAHEISFVDCISTWINLARQKIV